MADRVVVPFAYSRSIGWVQYAVAGIDRRDGDDAQEFWVDHVRKMRRDMKASRVPAELAEAELVAYADKVMAGLAKTFTDGAGAA